MDMFFFKWTFFLLIFKFLRWSVLVLKFSTLRLKISLYLSAKSKVKELSFVTSKELNFYWVPITRFISVNRPRSKHFKKMLVFTRDTHGYTMTSSCDFILVEFVV